jgi:methyl-accepting chemotaxis protein
MAEADKMPTQDKPKKPRNFRSLTITLAIAFLALSAVVLLIASSLDVYFTIQTQQEVIANQQQLIAKDAANTVKGFIQEKFSVLETASSIGDVVTAPYEQQSLVLNKLIGLESSFRQLILLDAQGQEVMRASRLSGMASGQLMKQNSSDILYQLSRGETYISSVYIDEVTSEPMVIIAVPEKDVFGDPEGILVAEVNLKFMWDMVAGIKIGRNGLAYVVDKQGNLIAFGDISRVLRGENLIHLEEVNEFVKGDEMIRKSSADVSVGIQGSQVVANHAHLGKPDWAVVVELPVEEAYENVIMEIGLSALTMLISFFLAILAGLYLSKRITRPIISLRNAAAEIGEGRLDTKIEVKTRNEIGELASAFNQMAGDLKKSRKEIEDYSKTLEKKVKERTKELEQTNEELERFNKLAVGRELKMIELKKRIKELEGKLSDKSGKQYPY